ncbi:MAG: hypothetical protein KAJ78_07575 [Acidobacteria bacterium]|nr:hypothetical protein [Acidobacteriota bacterium]
MSDKQTLLKALETDGPYAVWDLMTDDERRLAAQALWRDADREARSVVETALAKELKFRTHALRKLPAEKLAARLVRMAPEMPDTLLFQFLFYLHMGERRALMVEFLDAVGVPHDDGVLNLPEDAEPPAKNKVEKAGRDLLKAHDHEALVYLATLRVADKQLWGGLEPVLEEQEAGKRPAPGGVEQARGPAPSPFTGEK